MYLKLYLKDKVFTTKKNQQDEISINRICTEGTNIIIHHSPSHLYYLPAFVMLV